MESVEARAMKDVSPSLNSLPVPCQSLEKDTGGNAALAIFLREPGHDGRHWDCQCARCGSTLHFVECEACAGEGVDDHECGEDCCCCADPTDNVTCDICDGKGSFPSCLASPEWCHAHPLTGREGVERHTAEWFTTDPPGYSRKKRVAGGNR